MYNTIWILPLIWKLLLQIQIFLSRLIRYMKMWNATILSDIVLESDCSTWSCTTCDSVTLAHSKSFICWWLKVHLIKGWKDDQRGKRYLVGSKRLGSMLFLFPCTFTKLLNNINLFWNTCIVFKPCSASPYWEGFP